MAYELTQDEKIGIINTQFRNVSYRKYSHEIDLVVENASATPDASRISEINLQISNCNSQLSALTAELESLSE